MIIGQMQRNEAIHTILIEPKDETINTLPPILTHYKAFSQGVSNPVPEVRLKSSIDYSIEFIYENAKIS